MRWLTWSSLEKHRDLGLLVMRVGLGLMMMTHGFPKVAGGPTKWEKLGGAMGALGIDAWPVFWGAAASFTELVGGLLVALGLATRPSALLVTVTMVVAAAMHLDKGDGLGGASHAIETGLAFFGLVVLGAGRYSLDARLQR